MNSQLLRKLVQKIDATKLDLHLFSLRFCLYFSCQTLDKRSKPWTGTWRSTSHKVTRIVWMTWHFQAVVPFFASPNPHWRVSSCNWIELIFNTCRWLCGCPGIRHVAVCNRGSRNESGTPSPARQTTPRVPILRRGTPSPPTPNYATRCSKDPCS